MRFFHPRNVHSEFAIGIAIALPLSLPRELFLFFFFFFSFFFFFFFADGRRLPRATSLSVYPPLNMYPRIRRAQRATRRGRERECWILYRRLAVPVVKGTKPSGKPRLSLPHHRAFPSRLKDRREISEFWRRTLWTKRWAFCAFSRTRTRTRGRNMAVIIAELPNFPAFSFSLFPPFSPF